MTKFLTAKWENLIMANYEVPAAVLEKYLPKGVELDLYNNKAYVSLVGFLFKNVKIFKVPIPFLGTFEEVNLRFYVKRESNGKTYRGVVFINETVPYRAVAFVANLLYKEHYVVIPTKHKWSEDAISKTIKYDWLVKNKWNTVEVTAKNELRNMLEGSFEEFIFEHYIGYSKVSDTSTESYNINHPKWKTYQVLNADVKCNFEDNYGKDFAFLNHSTPEVVYLAKGSNISVDWKRSKF